MKCPHCTVTVHAEWYVVGTAGSDADGDWDVIFAKCPACNRVAIKARLHNDFTEEVEREFIAYPKGSNRPLPPEIPPGYAEDFREACLVLPDSPKASAALSRRCLQALLRGPGGVTPGSLRSEITQVLPTLPTYLRDAVDSVRVAGNFAAHPLKDTNTGEIVAVEPGEAAQLLDVLELLFDLYFVQPARTKAMKASWGAKLVASGSTETVR